MIGRAMSDETSPGGSRLYRHENAPAHEDQQLSGGDPDLIEAIDRHLDQCFGEDGSRWVFHELVSPTIHLDVHVIPPTQDFELQRLVTSGIAEAPMTVPDGFRETPFAELTIALPREWMMSQEAFADERVYWPVRLLKRLGRLPHDHSTFLWYGHTIPNGDPPEPYADGTELCCALIAYPLLAPREFNTLELGNGRSVRFLGVIPIYEDEMRFKLEKGSDALYDLFDEHEVTDLVDLNRSSVVPKKRRLLGR